jgi:cell division protein FtsB
MSSMGLYVAGTMAKAALNNLPKMFWGEHPHTVASRLLSWSAPVASNLVGLFMNMDMRQDTIEQNKSNILKMESELIKIKGEMDKLEQEQHHTA